MTGERRWGWIVGGLIGAAGAGAGLWIAVDPPPPGPGAWVLLAVFAVSFGAWVFSGRSRGGQVRSARDLADGNPYVIRMQRTGIVEAA